MNDTTKNIERDILFEKFLREDKGRINLIIDMQDRLIEHTNQLITSNLKKALSQDKNDKNIISEEAGEKQIHQWIDKNVVLVYEITKPRFGHIWISISFNRNFLQWQIEMGSRVNSTSANYINKLEINFPGKYSDTPAKQVNIDKIEKYLIEIEAIEKDDFIRDKNQCIYKRIDIVGDTKRDIKILQDIMQNIFTRLKNY